MKGDVYQMECIILCHLGESKRHPPWSPA